jgi:phosphoglycolate phosphatase
MQTKAVIFDYDGVLIDSLGLVYKCYSEITKEFDNKSLKNLSGKFDIADIDWHVTLQNAGITDPADVQRVIEIFWKVWNENKSMLKPIEGIKPMLEKLSKKYKLGIASNNWEKSIKESLEQFSLLKYFSSIAGSERGMFKPDPGLLLICAEELGVLPQETVYIGDMDGDIVAAKAANMKKAIAVTFGFHSHEKLLRIKPDVIVHKPNELIEAVK